MAVQAYQTILLLPASYWRRRWRHFDGLTGSSGGTGVAMAQETQLQVQYAGANTGSGGGGGGCSSPST